MKNKVTTRDRGAKALVRRLEVSGEVTVGIHEAEGAQAKEGDDDSGMSLIDVAIIHEFGSDAAGIPRRSFIADWVDENEPRHRAEAEKMGKLVIAGKMTTEMALKRLGVLRQAEVQKRISDGLAPELAQSTIDRKGSSTPLINTGQLRTGISHKVETKR